MGGGGRGIVQFCFVLKNTLLGWIEWRFTFKFVCDFVFYHLRCFKFLISAHCLNVTCRICWKVFAKALNCPKVIHQCEAWISSAELGWLSWLKLHHLMTTRENKKLLQDAKYLPLKSTQSSRWFSRFSAISWQDCTMTKKQLYSKTVQYCNIFKPFQQKMTFLLNEYITQKW